MEPEQFYAVLTSAFAALDVLEASGTTFFYAHKSQGRPQDQYLRFAPMITGDDHDACSQLRRPACTG